MVLTWYDVLGVEPDATPDELRAAYRSHARRLHPDVRPGRDEHPDENDEMRLLNEAWRVLGDPALRQQYDATFPVLSEPAMTAPHGIVFRPWIAVLVVLALIFVLTAYAAPH